MRQNIGHVRADRPPSEHAMLCLRRALRAPFPAQEVNFTVRDKLLQWGYAEMVQLPSPYKTHRPGRMVPFLKITEAGKKALTPPAPARGDDHG